MDTTALQRPLQITQTQGTIPATTQLVQLFLKELGFFNFFNWHSNSSLSIYTSNDTSTAFYLSNLEYICF